MKILIFGDTSNWNIPDFSVSNINSEIVNKIKKADYVIYNLEGPIKINNKRYNLQLRENKIKDYFLKLLLKITGKEQPIVSSNKRILKLLKLNPNTTVSLANNHIKDLGVEGFKDTIKLLEENNIKYLGAGLSNKEASKDILIKNIVIINCNFVSSEKKGIKWKIYNANKDYGASYQNYEELRKKVNYYKKNKKQVILIIHGGKEMPTKSLGINLENIKSIGANISIVHHFHKYIKTNYEKYNIYCIGDFIFSRPELLPEERNSCFLYINQNNVKLIKFKNNEVYNYN